VDIVYIQFIFSLHEELSSSDLMRKQWASLAFRVLFFKLVHGQMI